MKTAVFSTVLFGLIFYASGQTVTGPKSSTELEIEKLQGTWQLVYQQSNGKKLPDEKTAEMLHGKMVFDRSTLRYTVELPGFDFEFAYKPYPNRQPKVVDMQLINTSDKKGIGQKCFGIYLLEKDNLKICYNKTERPTDFDAGEGSHNVLIVLKRSLR
jgi:uncharacterized protein (TIGR03067 family)